MEQKPLPLAALGILVNQPAGVELMSCSLPDVVAKVPSEFGVQTTRSPNRFWSTPLPDLQTPSG